MSLTLALVGLTGLAGRVAADVAPDPQPTDNSVVAGSIAFVVFAALIVAVILIGRSLVTRLKNVDRAAAEGLYDPSDPKPTSAVARQRPGRGLNAPRPPSQ